MIKKILFLFSMLLTFSAIYYADDVFAADVYYATHVSTIGWQTTGFVNGDIAGTTGQSLGIEAIKIQIPGITVKYQVHVRNIGWMDWVQTVDNSPSTIAAVAGTTGLGLPIEAIRIQLVNAPKYHIQYQVHVQDIGWMNWVSDGATAGTTGLTKRIEAIKITISNETGAYPPNPEMDSTYRGFNYGQSTGRQVVYYQYGSLNWTNNIHYGLNQLIDNPAAVSGYWGSSYSSADIVVSSNYWSTKDWAGLAYAPINAQKTVNLNSSIYLSDSTRKYVTTHELLHCWGVMDCINSHSIECGYYDVVQVNYITDDVTNLLLRRYN